jgi:hypothetical protein
MLTLFIYIRGDFKGKAQDLVEDCQDVKLKISLSIICLKYDFYTKFNILGVMLLKESWLCNIVERTFSH